MKIGVIGLGLIGGSIFKNLTKQKKYDVIGISRSLKRKKVYKDLKKLSDCDVVFVCTPINNTLETLEKLDNILSKNTIVTDVCSVKSFLSKQEYSFHFVPSHPMAGTENSGWESSFPELFQNAKWAITPINGIYGEKEEILEAIIESMGAEALITTPDEHDRAVAMISHMPMLVAQALCANIEDNKLAQTLASSGFRDTTRLALSNTQMAEDMINMNTDNIKDAIVSFNKQLNLLLKDDYRKKIEHIKTFRNSLYSLK